MDETPRIKSHTVSREDVQKEVVAAKDDFLDGETDFDRPKTRGECESASRPCPFVGCSHHLYLDVHPHTGAIKLNFPHLEVWEMSETCSLDVSDRGGITLAEIGSIMNLTRERVRQVEQRGLKQLEASGETFKETNGNDPT